MSYYNDRFVGNAANDIYGDYLQHYGVLGQKWGVRNYQNYDGSYKPGAEGRYSSSGGSGRYRSGSAKTKVGAGSSGSSGGTTVAKKKGLSTGAKVAIGAGIAAAATIGAAALISKYGANTKAGQLINNVKDTALGELGNLSLRSKAYTSGITSAAKDGLTKVKNKLTYGSKHENSYYDDDYGTSASEARAQKLRNASLKVKNGLKKAANDARGEMANLGLRSKAYTSGVTSAAKDLATSAKNKLTYGSKHENSYYDEDYGTSASEARAQKLRDAGLKAKNTIQGELGNLNLRSKAYTSGVTSAAKDLATSAKNKLTYGSKHENSYYDDDYGTSASEARAQKLRDAGLAAKKKISSMAGDAKAAAQLAREEVSRRAGDAKAGAQLGAEEVGRRLSNARGTISNVASNVAEGAKNAASRAKTAAYYNTQNALSGLSTAANTGTGQLARRAADAVGTAAATGAAAYAAKKYYDKKKNSSK